MKSVVVLALILLALGEAWAADPPTPDTVSTGTASASTTVTSTHTKGGGCLNSYAVVAVAWQLSPPGTVSSVSYGASAMANLGGLDNLGGDKRLEFWGLANPPSGAQTVTATLGSSANALSITTRTYCGVHQSVSTGTLVSAADATLTASVNVTSASDETVLDAIYANASAGAVTVGGGQTEDSHFSDDGGATHATSTETPGSTTTTMSWSVTNEEYWIVMGVALKPAPAAATTIILRRPIILE